MKLWDIPQGSKIKEDVFDDSGKIGDTIIFDHIDGMYSYCTVEGKPDKVLHLSAGTPLKEVSPGVYIIDDEKEKV